MPQKSNELPDNTRRLAKKGRPISGRPIRNTESREATVLPPQSPLPPSTPKATAQQAPSQAPTQRPITARPHAQPVAAQPSVKALPAQRYAAYIPLAGGFGGIALAAAGELLVESGNKTPLSLLLYLLGIAAFAVSAWYVPPTPQDLPQSDAEPTAPTPPQPRRAW